MILERIICLVIGYAFGLFQTAYFYGKAHGIDIRKHGSGNSGTTNALRVLGTKAGLIVFAGDCLKCMLAIFLTRILFGGSHEDIIYLLALYTATGVILGHNFPFYMNFKEERVLRQQQDWCCLSIRILFRWVCFCFSAHFYSRIMYHWALCLYTQVL